MSDQDKNLKDMVQYEGIIPELSDPWEQRFKFEIRDRLHSHIIERDISSKPSK